ncbi:fibronectin type III-like domain-contianing protein [Polaribacter sp. Z014]|uniref:fibronectin type III-like domain-contianing protein n=1 Tax=Polaribacter sp. Z014 TaxID=2927126 RepID=UPI0020217045|nr:fibronectin type III-like domain-contianing protein [Polaribacter sp. Z014]MCL7762774.1 fibronectin type III-like domain-contianing protein [Polaribacter sp. Z014]
MYPFGYGLSYTQFEIQDIKLDKNRLEAMGDVLVTAKVTNIGDRDGDEIVQVYVRDKEASHIVPKKALKGFKRIHIPSGESKTVTIKLPYEAFSHYDTSLKAFKVEAGDFEIMIGQSSEKIVGSKTIAVAEGVIPKIRVGQKSGYFNAEDENRTKKWDYLYEKGALEDVKTNQLEDASSKYISYEILFIDPGVYVNTWDAELSFKSTSKNAVLEASMQGVKISTYKVGNKKTQSIKIPIPPEYGKPVKLKLKTLKGKIEHESIKIFPPGGKNPFVITKVIEN